MEMMINFLLLIIAAALLLGRRRPRSENSKEISAMPGILPEPQNDLKQEMENRIAEFMEFDAFGLVIRPEEEA